MSILEASQEGMGRPAQACDEQVGAYFNLVVRGRILGKTFAAIGGIPVSLGLFLFEVMMLQAAAGEGDVQKIGPLMSQWRRIIMLTPFWKHIRKLEQALTNLFLCA